MPWVAAGLLGVTLAMVAELLVEWQMTRPEAPPPPVHAAPGPVSNSDLPASTRPRPFRKAPEPLRRLQVIHDGPALGEAARQGDVARVREILEAGISPDAVDAQDRPVLFAAVEAGETGTTRLLLEAAADLNLSLSGGKTPLMVAAERGDLPMVELLLEFDGATDFQDIWGHTPLAYAIREGQTGVAGRLMEEAAPVGGPCCEEGRQTALTHALETRKLELLDAVLQYVHPAEWSTPMREALMNGIRRENRELVRVLLAGHTTPPTPEGFRQPLLGYAIVWGQEPVVRLLLECGADANTPLQSPVEPAFAKLVASKVLRHYLENEPGMTPLMLAAGMEREGMVKALLEHGAKRGAVTRKSRWAALSFAARTSNTAVMQLLLGKDPAPEAQRVRIEILLGSQVARLWKDRELVYTTRISTGRPGYRTPSGEFVVTDKHRRRVSNLYHVDMPYFMRLSCSAYGMHAGVVPDYPASHGCIRLPHAAAKRFFREVEVGTLVTIR